MCLQKSITLSGFYVESFTQRACSRISIKFDEKEPLISRVLTNLSEFRVNISGSVRITLRWLKATPEFLIFFHL